MTALGNDQGFISVFSKAIQSKKGDMLIAISSSGESMNILQAVNNFNGAIIVTLSGLSCDNVLRGLGHLNFYVSTNDHDYGMTEIAHTAILHYWVDRL